MGVGVAVAVATAVGDGEGAGVAVTVGSGIIVEVTTGVGSELFPLQAEATTIKATRQKATLIIVLMALGRSRSYIPQEAGTIEPSNGG